MKSLSYCFVIAILVEGCAAVQPSAKPLAADDIFAPYVAKVPKVCAVVGESVADGVKVTRLRFAGTEGSLEGTTGPCEIYAILARPAAPAKGKHPAILFCHGGGGFAREDAAIGWAKLGYVCISPDLVGYADQTKVKSVSRVTGRKYTEDIVNLSKGRYTCTMFDAVVSGLGAFNLLASQEDVDKSRVGITGASCGGYMVTMLSGLLDTRIKAIFNLYGSGFVQYKSVFGDEVANLPPAQQKIWIDNFDAGVRLPRARGTYLVYAAINDHFFSNKSVIATYDACAGPKYICWAPNSNHAIMLPGGTTAKAPPLFTEMEPAYFACVLGGNKPPLPKVAAVLASAGATTLTFTVRNCPREVQPWVWYSPAADPMLKHENRKWEKLGCQQIERAGSDGTFTFTLPASPDSFDWFGGITFTLTVGEVQRPMSLSTALCHREKDKGDAAVK